MTGYIIDGVVILILLIGAISGLRKGLIESILSLITTGGAFLVSVFFAKDITVFVCQYVDIQSWIESYVESIATGSTVHIFGMNPTVSEASSLLTVVLVGILTFVIIKLAIAILIKICNSISNYSPTFNGLNRFLGFIFGAAKNAVLVCLILIICCFCKDLPTIGEAITNAINQSYITNFAYTYVEMFAKEYLTVEYLTQLIDQVQAVIK